MSVNQKIINNDIKYFLQGINQIRALLGVSRDPNIQDIMSNLQVLSRQPIHTYLDEVIINFKSIQLP